MSLMIKIAFPISIILVLGLSFYNANSYALEIDAFSSSNNPFILNQSKINLCYLDQLPISKDRLNKAWQSNQNHNQFFSEHQTELTQLQKAYQCDFLAKKFKIQKIPTIVFDHQSVLFGERNINAAIHYYYHHQGDGI